MDLFDSQESKINRSKSPLAERMRPRVLNEFLGQNRIIALLTRLIEREELPSLILWGPSGCGKTTLANIIAEVSDVTMVSFSAVLSGVKEVREVFKEAQRQLRLTGRRTILFIDEIHRFNKAQQDAFLHHVEDGTIILIGATTENPSFSLNAPLLSRCKVLVLEELSQDNIVTIITRALTDRERGLGNLAIEMTEEAIEFLSSHADGDARTALNTVEVASTLVSPGGEGKRIITIDIAEEAMQKRVLLYDKGGEEHYNIISAFIKSMRGSDPDASLYWLARMVEAGEDPLFIARRMIIFAAEDIGNADPQALQIANGVKDAVHFVGMPEGWIPLAQGTTYLATAPKSNASYLAYREALEDVRKEGHLPVPLHIRNAPTKLMKELGYGAGYRYPHNFNDALVNQEYLPEKLTGREYYKPRGAGAEKEVLERLRNIRKLRTRKP
ncbi:MAG: replication-associated recombination protein A [Deltaproteobacteria bacterium]|nr:replication-associated recombination protein A [Deltaproteobacteria bacterium]